MSKAYDHVEWGFLERMMRKLGFCEEWIRIILRCVSTVSYTFIINGQARGYLVPERGIRQGDALSPYLFLLCGEFFSQLIGEAERKGRLGGIRICRRAPAISHMLFADDSFVFCRAETGDCVTLQGIFKNYERTTGQQINFLKSAISFSPNTEEEEQVRLADLLGVSRTLAHDSYLGMPLFFGKGKVKAFRYLTQKMRKKAEGWKEKCLSIAGREVLIKSVLQSIPTYVMSCVELPKALCDEMHNIMARFWWGETENNKKIHWMTWEKLCKPKHEGGMGFKDMHDFNIALLAKQAWRLHSWPESLLAQVLKARYFPHESFLETGLKPRSSMIWRSLIAGRDSLIQGLRFRVGSGDDINVWRDRWIDLPHRLRPFSTAPVGLEELKVAELMAEGTTSWDVNKLHSLFIECEVDIIARIPLSMRRVKDEVVWNYNKDGRYTVRSGYQVARQLRLAPLQASSSGGSSGKSTKMLWKRLWRATIPGKIKIFVWRLISYCIPTKWRLQQRHCQTQDLMCLLCRREVETDDHAFLKCKVVRLIWSQVSRGTELQDANNISVKEWLLLCLESADNSTVELVCTCLWLIWRERNMCLWEGKSPYADGVVHRACRMVEDYRRFHAKQGGEKIRQHVKLKQPPRGRLKINIDGAYDGIARRGGIGVIVRDDKGVGVAAVARSFEHASSAFHMEVEACRTSLKLGLDQGWQHIEVESDSILLVSAFNNGDTSMLEVGHILRDCLELSKFFQSCHVDHVYREGNSVADRLATLARKSVIDGLWLGEMPICVQDVLFEDSSSISISARSSGCMPPPVQSCTLHSANKVEEDIEPFN